ASHIAMARQVFRGRVHHQIGTQIEGPLQERCRPGVVADTASSYTVGDIGHPGNVGDRECWVGGGLYPDDPGAGGDGTAHRVEITHVDKAGGEPPWAEYLRQHLAGAVVRVGR